MQSRNRDTDIDKRMDTKGGGEWVEWTGRLGMILLTDTTDPLYQYYWPVVSIHTMYIIDMYIYTHIYVYNRYVYIHTYICTYIHIYVYMYSQPRDRSQVSHIASGFFTSWATREALHFYTTYKIDN